MQISFNPHNPQDIELVRKLIDGESQQLSVEYVTGGLDTAERIDQGGQYDPAEQEALQSQVDSAQVFAGNGVQNATHSPAQAPTGGVSVAPASSAGQVELDSAGIPWDARIHADTKAQNKNGTWRNKRGADKEYIKQITDELRAQYSEVSQATVPPQPQQSQQGTIDPPPAVQQQQQQSAGNITTFPEFMKAVVEYNTANNLTMADINSMLSSAMGINNTALLATNTDRIPEALANLGIQ